MVAISRRGFLQASSSALGAYVLRAREASSAPADAVREDSSSARVYCVFFGIAPSPDDTDLRPTTNEEIVQQLQELCPGVEFVVRDLTRGVSMQTVINEAGDLQRQGYDGVLIYGWPREYDLLRTGLPTINVAVIADFMNTPYPLFSQHRVIDAFLDPWKFCAKPDVSRQMMLDLADKVKLIRMLKQMKSERILTVTDSPYVNVTYGDTLKQMGPDYNDRILETIRQVFGTEVTKIGSPEVVSDPYIQQLWREENAEANEIAQRWIRDAQKMINTIESEVVRSAKVYLAMKWLMEKHEATGMAFHIRDLVANPRPEDRVFPALATSEFQLRHQVAKCQSHLNIVLSEMMLQYAYGRPSMLGDFAVDPYNNTSMVQHCEGPWNPWGDERRVPYILTDHRERLVRQRSRPGVGAASWILYPGDETVTMWQIDVETRQIFVHTGKTVPMLSGAALYRDHLYEMM